MAMERSVGFKLSVSATTPATNTKAAFAALTFTGCGRLSKIPEEYQGKFDVASHDDLTTGEETKFADMLRAGGGDIELGFDNVDAGQTILKAKKGEQVSFLFTSKSGVKFYINAIILSYNRMPAVGSVLMAKVSVEFYGIGVDG